MSPKGMAGVASVGAPVSWLAYRFVSEVLPWQWCIVYFVTTQLLLLGVLAVALVRSVGRKP
jgi:hypothetical protein